MKKQANAVKGDNAYAFADMYTGNFYLKNRIHSKSLTFYFNALNLFKKIDNNKFIGQIYSSIGAAYRYLGDYEKSSKFAMLSYSASQDAPKPVIAKILNRIGDMQRDLNNIDSAFLLLSCKHCTMRARLPRGIRR